ncbi:MAG: cytochrome P450, partial [Actinobacteria bacterium]|nr:cytochrome P450 [Actinomycetota bacterium]
GNPAVALTFYWPALGRQIRVEGTARADPPQLTADDFLARSEDARAMALSAWGTANMRTGGDDIAQALALMGVRPRWDWASGRVIGFDPEKRSTVREMTLRVVADFEDPEKGPQAFMDFAMFGAGEVMARAENPKDDFLTELSRAELNGKPLGPLEIGQIMNSFLIAGHGTSVAAMASLLHEVLSRPELTQRLKDNPELIPSAVEETLRLHTPFFGLYKRATRDVELGGVTIPQDSYIQACWAAANRDPKVYDNPDQFDVDRKFGRKNRHLTFGFGVHACPGAPTARMELRVALEELLKRLPDITLDNPGAVTYEFRGTETAAIPTLPATFTPQP